MVLFFGSPVIVFAVFLATFFFAVAFFLATFFFTGDFLAVFLVFMHADFFKWLE